MHVLFSLYKAGNGIFFAIKKFKVHRKWYTETLIRKIQLSFNLLLVQLMKLCNSHEIIHTKKRFTFHSTKKKIKFSNCKSR